MTRHRRKGFTLIDMKRLSFWFLIVNGKCQVIDMPSWFRIIQMETLSNLNWPIRAVIPAKVGNQESDGFSGFPLLRL